MCNALWECLKCPAKVVCCCCKCACSMLLGIFGLIILLIIIGLIIYFTVFYKRNDDGTIEVATAKALMSVVTPATFKDFFHKAQ
ncbi:protein midgut expression 1 isoform X2 [Episyrphus balteatus]|uniref:protein midgut expression 1 isoform X2 n=1 Tax=Episyrphus balteatus TaxID=286459 RepID=UPI0024868FCF|nr:protein midgut expression 1 isoform X2 [Episyrphus balteatus]